MKTKICAMAILLVVLISCNSARKAEVEKKKTQQKMEELDQNKQQFELKNPK